MQVYIEAGPNGFGLGSGIYRAGDSAAQTSKKAGQFVKAAKNLF